jgi:hypothetical protein
LELIGVGVGVLGFAGATDGTVLDGESASIGLDANVLLVHRDSSLLDLVNRAWFAEIL